MQAAGLVGARLDRSNLNGAQLQGAVLRGALLQGAVLRGALLQGAFLNGALLQGADLRDALLQGAVLYRAQLQGATLWHALLQGADLRDALLQGADLRGALLQGAVLNGALLQGANLRDALLQGADLGAAQLQGAQLAGAQMADSEFDKTLVFRTAVTDADLAAAAIRSVQGDNPFKPLTAADVDGWKAAATEFASDTDKARIAERFARLKLDFQTHEADAADQAKWSELKKQSLALDPDGAQHRRRLATILGDLACEDFGAPPLAAHALFGRLAALGDQLDGVRNRLKDGRNKPETCPGVAGFTEGDWRALEAIKPAQDQPSP